MKTKPAVLATLLNLALCIPAFAQNGTWTNTISGMRSDPNNWLNGIIADGAGSTAFFNTIDVPSNSTITVTMDTTNLVSVINANLLIGDTDTTTNSPLGNWVLADAGFPLTLDNTTTSNSIVDVNLARGAANNLTVGWATATITANLAGTNTLVKSGPSHLILNPLSANAHSGGMVISNGMVQLGVANQAGTANGAAPGTGPIIFRGGSLRLQNAAISGNNPGNGGNGVTALSVPVIVETGQTGTIYLSARAFPAMSSPVSGGGTLNVIADFVRDNLDGDWSGFTGRVNFAASARQATSDLRFAGGLVGASLANARMNITTNGLNNNNLAWYNNGAFGATFVIGELSASVANVVNLIANNTGAGAGNALPFVLQVGGLNTTATFSGNFGASAAAVTNGVSIIKEGTGTWILTGATMDNNGMMVVSNGVLQIGSGTSGKLGRTAVISNYATLAFGRSDTLVVTNVIDGPGTVQQRGAGSLILLPSSGANTYTGKTVVTNGLLVAVPESALGPNPASLIADQLTLNGGGLRSTNDQTIAGSNRGVTLGSAGGRLSPDTNTTLTVASVIAGTGSLTINGAGTATLTGANACSGKTILTSGTLALSGESFFGAAPGVATADQITFNGGTLRSTVTFAIDDSNRGVTISAPGGTIAPDAATTLTISEPIVGAGALTKSGAGTLTLNGADSRTGNTLVNQGVLAIGAGGSLSSPVISVAGGATFDVSALGGGFTLSSGKTLTGNGTIVGTLTAGSGSTLSAGTSVGALNVSGNLVLNGGATNLVEISPSTNDVINVSGNLTLTGVNVIRLSILALLPAGQYPLIKYGTLTGDASNLLLQGYPLSRVNAALVVNAVNKSIDLILTGSNGAVEWTGGRGGNAWDVNTTTNWLNAGVPSAFFNDDTASFTDIGATNPSVNLVATVIPGQVVVNSATDYAFSGNGKISGIAGLSKSGPNTLTVLTTNDYLGTTVIGGGTVRVGNGTAAGSLGTGNITNNASLAYNVAGSQTVANVISGTGSLTVQAGTLALTGNNSYGASVINGGTTLQVGANGGTGSLGTGGVTDNGALVYRRTGTVTNLGSISGTGSLAVQAAGTVVLAANNSYAGTTTVDTGTLQVGSGGIAGSIGSAGSVSLTNAGRLAFNRSDIITNVVTVLGTNGTLAQFGTGTLVITNEANDYGPTLITAGKLQLGDGVNASGQLGRGTITITNPGSLVVNRPDVYTLTNLIAGNGSLIHIGPTNLNITTVGGANTYSGGTTISNSVVVLVAPVTAPVLNGVQQVNGSGLGSGSVTFQGNSFLQFHWADMTDPDGNGAGNFANAINVPAGQTGTIWLPGRFEFSSSVTGFGTLNLGVNYVRGNVSGSWTNFTGLLNVITNILNPNDVANDFRVFNAIGFPNARVHLIDGVSMYWRGTANSIVPIGELSGDLTAFIGGTGGAEGGNAVTWRVGRLNTDSTYAGTIGGTVAVGIIKEGTGTWKLTGVNGYVGNTTISNGVLALSTNALGANGDITASSLITVVSPGVLNLMERTDATFSVGAATPQTIAGNGSITGNLSVGGVGTLSPGLSIGTLTVSGNVTNTGGYLVEVDRAAAQNSDRLVAQNIDLTGTTITVTNIGSGLASGDTFRIVQANGGIITGAPALVTGGLPPGPGASWDLSNLTINGTIRIVLPRSPVLTNSVSGGGTTLDFSWDNAYLGYRLYAQTNNVGIGLRTNWVAITNTETMTSITVGIDRNAGSVFYRLAWP